MPIICDCGYIAKDETDLDQHLETCKEVDKKFENDRNR